MTQQDKIIEVARNLKESLMQKLFTEGIGHTEFKDSEIGQIPKSWEVVSLGEIASVKYGKANPKTTGNIPLVGSGGIYGWVERPLVTFPTIVIGRKGTAGEVWLMELPSWPSDTTFYLEWKKQTEPRFLSGYLSLNKLSGEHARTTLPSLQKFELEKIKIPLPSISEQEKISQIMITVDKKTETEEKRKAVLQQLFKTMLHKLTTGEIKVKDLDLGVYGVN